MEENNLGSDKQQPNTTDTDSVNYFGGDGGNKETQKKREKEEKKGALGRKFAAWKQARKVAKEERLAKKAERKAAKEAQQDSLGKSKLNKKTRNMIIIAGCALVILINGAFFLAWWLPELRMRDRLVIGDTTLTQEDADSLAEWIREYLERFPGADIQDIEQQAWDDLIMNAGLQYYAKNICGGIEITTQDVLRAVGIDSTSEDNASAIIDWQLGPVGSFARIRAENIAYQLVMTDCIIKSREIFVAYAALELPYFLNMDAETRRDAIDDTEDMLRRQFLPLFEAGWPADIIAERADVGHSYSSNPVLQGIDAQFDDHSEEAEAARMDALAGLMSDGPITFAIHFQCNPGSCMNTIDFDAGIDMSSAMSPWAAASSLANIGDHTDVVLLNNAALGIVRLENMTHGEHESYEAFLEHLKNRFGYTRLSRVMNATGTFVRSAVDGFFGMLGMDRSIFSSRVAASGRCDFINLVNENEIYNHTGANQGTPCRYAAVTEYFFAAYDALNIRQTGWSLNNIGTGVLASSPMGRHCLRGSPVNINMSITGSGGCNYASFRWTCWHPMPTFGGTPNISHPPGLENSGFDRVWQEPNMPGGTAVFARRIIAGESLGGDFGGMAAANTWVPSRIADPNSNGSLRINVTSRWALLVMYRNSNQAPWNFEPRSTVHASPSTTAHEGERRIHAGRVAPGATIRFVHDLTKTGEGLATTQGDVRFSSGCGALSGVNCSDPIVATVHTPTLRWPFERPVVANPNPNPWEWRSPTYTISNDTPNGTEICQRLEWRNAVTVAADGSTAPGSRPGEPRDGFSEVCVIVEREPEMCPPPNAHLPIGHPDCDPPGGGDDDCFSFPPVREPLNVCGIGGHRVTQLTRCTYAHGGTQYFTDTWLEGDITDADIGSFERRELENDRTVQYNNVVWTANGRWEDRGHRSSSSMSGTTGCACGAHIAGTCNVQSGGSAGCDSGCDSDGSNCWSYCWDTRWCTASWQFWVPNWQWIANDPTVTSIEPRIFMSRFSDQQGTTGGRSWARGSNHTDVNYITSEFATQRAAGWNITSQLYGGALYVRPTDRIDFCHGSYRGAQEVNNAGLRFTHSRPGQPALPAQTPGRQTTPPQDYCRINASPSLGTIGFPPTLRPARCTGYGARQVVTNPLHAIRAEVHLMDVGQTFVQNMVFSGTNASTYEEQLDNEINQNLNAGDNLPGFDCRRVPQWMGGSAPTGMSGPTFPGPPGPMGPQHFLNGNFSSPRHGAGCGNSRAFYHYRSTRINQPSGQGQSEDAVVRVPYNYNIEIEVNNTVDSRIGGTGVRIAPPGAAWDISVNLHVRPRINEHLEAQGHSDPNYATHTKTTQWRLVKAIKPPEGHRTGYNTATTAGQQVNTTVPCGHLTGLLGGGACDTAVHRDAAPGGGLLQDSYRIFNHPDAPSGRFSLDGSTEDVMTNPKGFFVDDVAPGTTICYMFSVFPASGNDPGGGGYLSDTTAGDSWAHSEPVCVVAAKRPLSTVQGAGLFSPGGISVNQTTKTPCFSDPTFTGIHGAMVDSCWDPIVGSGSRSVFGSWSEYEIVSGHGPTSGWMASGSGFGYTQIPRTLSPSIAGFRTRFWPSHYWHPGAATIGLNHVVPPGSGAADFPDGSAPHPADSLEHNPLTITNFGGNFTAYEPPMRHSNLGRLIQRLSEITTIYDPITNESTHTISRRCSNLSNVVPGTSVLCLSDTTVTISQDIVIDGGFSNISDLPQVIIMAPNIIISENVERVDAWLVTARSARAGGDMSMGADQIWGLAEGGAIGHVYTCDSRTAVTTVSDRVCNRPLIINGPVIVGTALHNIRTGGAGIGRESANPSEVFNLRADTYLWLHYRIQDNRAAHTSVVFELAPRL